MSTLNFMNEDDRVLIDQIIGKVYNLFPPQCSYVIRNYLCERIKFELIRLQKVELMNVYIDDQKLRLFCSMVKNNTLINLKKLKTELCNLII